MPQHRRTSRSTVDGYDAVVRRPSSGDNWIALTGDPLPVGQAHDWAVSPSCGAVVLFSGTVRDHAEGRVDVRHLTYEAFEERAEASMAAVAAEARSRWPEIGRIVIWHRTGRLDLGESSVVVAVSTPHRPSAFEAARYMIDAVKASAPIWKHEEWSGGADWGADATPIVSPGEVGAERA
jgi:molybdopterin synthase catalytic subunit